ncbi:hypothetical protein ABT186_28665 [Streptomyces sp. NPDC001634]|uniref:LexA family protein n=1 Tax=Streptomyces sp. NPDC001634 TaxID=3154390 RepID=UPI00331FBDFD
MADDPGEDLTERQERILACIRETIAAFGEAPSVREISLYVGMRSKSGVHYQLRQIEKKGRIVIEPGRDRGIRLAR